MLLPGAAADKWLRPLVGTRWTLLVLLILCINYSRVYCMSPSGINKLREETRKVFYHGYDNYMRYAFPEDELRPLTCAPLVRDDNNPEDYGINDVLGNYSLTLIDSLSTLAILASSPSSGSDDRDSLRDFQKGVVSFVENYGDGTDSVGGHGKRARGFDLDSKVQVFETVIRGLGGLLSAHQFAVGDLPIRGYEPVTVYHEGTTGLLWDDGFVYDGQLLRLACDLGLRLLPAFHTLTGIPYPRVNLRTGVPFYENSPYNYVAEYGQCLASSHDHAEATRTCSAGAGSLVLEMTVLSRLSGDNRFEKVGKAAFWAIWNRRTSIGLVGSEIDPETGDWLSSYTGVGAGVDSFLEYAFKAHVLLSGLSSSPHSQANDSSTDFLSAWNTAYSGIKRHVYRGEIYDYPHYAQVDAFTGASRTFYVDSLGAFFPGLLTLAGQLEEAIENHLLYTALWTKFSSLPERWSMMSGKIEKGMGWWIGRPEFVESTWYLYRATQDPWYLHVGEMALRDIKRRCWTRCGWAGLRDVRTGEKGDRMESFFLGETIKYLFLLFDPKHPLNLMDAPYVFTTEAHPLIIPKHLRSGTVKTSTSALQNFNDETSGAGFCPVPEKSTPLTYSVVAARKDIFHASAVARLELATQRERPSSPLLDFNNNHPSVSLADLSSRSNYSFYPWTLPHYLVPPNGISSRLSGEKIFDLSFPTLPNARLGLDSLTRVEDGVVLSSVSGLRFSMVKEQTYVGSSQEKEEVFRIKSVSNVILARTEQVYITQDSVSSFDIADPYFSQVHDVATVDLVVDPKTSAMPETRSATQQTLFNNLLDNIVNSSRSVPKAKNALRIIEKLQEFDNVDDVLVHLEEDSTLSLLLSEAGIDLSSDPIEEQEAFNDPHNILDSSKFIDMNIDDDDEDNAESTFPTRSIITAHLSTGPGAAPFPGTNGYSADDSSLSSQPWTKIYFSNETCNDKLPASVPRDYQVIVMRRGQCTFTEKLRNIPIFSSSPGSLQLVIVVSYPENYAGEHAEMRAIRPLLERVQTTPSGIQRPVPIPMVLVDGGDEVWKILSAAAGIAVKSRQQVFSQGLRIANVKII